MGVQPSVHEEELFQDTSIHTDKGHDVLVDNFLNAQCKLTPPDTLCGEEQIWKTDLLVANYRLF